MREWGEGIKRQQKIFFDRKEKSMLKECLKNVRDFCPLIHNITNYVTVNDVANMILACGASPIMADELEEAEEITSICDGLNINIGTLNNRTIPAMLAAGKKAKELGHALLLDPVGAGASRLRTDTALKLIENIQFDIIRGNISEIKTLAKCGGHTKGVDADAADEIREDNLEQAISFIQAFAKETKSIIVVTGAIDVAADGKAAYVLQNGRTEMGKITGTGCQLSGLMTAFLAANKEHPLEAAAAAAAVMSVAGEIAWSYMQAGDGNSTYRNRIIDAVYNMDGDTLEKMAKIRKVER